MGAGMVNMPVEGTASEAPLSTGWGQGTGTECEAACPGGGGWGEESTEASVEKFPTKESE